HQTVPPCGVVECPNLTSTYPQFIAVAGLQITCDFSHVRAGNISRHAIPEGERENPIQPMKNDSVASSGYANYCWCLPASLTLQTLEVRRKTERAVQALARSVRQLLRRDLREVKPAASVNTLNSAI